MPDLEVNDFEVRKALAKSWGLPFVRPGIMYALLLEEDRQSMKESENHVEDAWRK